MVKTSSGVTRQNPDTMGQRSAVTAGASPERLQGCVRSRDPAHSVLPPSASVGERSREEALHAVAEVGGPILDFGPRTLGFRLGGPGGFLERLAGELGALFDGVADSFGRFLRARANLALADPLGPGLDLLSHASPWRRRPRAWVRRRAPARSGQWWPFPVAVAVSVLLPAATTSAACAHAPLIEQAPCRPCRRHEGIDFIEAVQVTVMSASRARPSRRP